MGQEYTRQLQNIRSIQLPVEEAWARSVYWMYGLVLSPAAGMSAVEFSEKLKDRDVETRPFFLGMHEQPVLLKQGFFKGENYPVTEMLSRQGLYLPSGIGLTGEQQAAVCSAVREVLS